MLPSDCRLPLDVLIAYATTGESADIASSLPETTAAVAWS